MWNPDLYYNALRFAAAAHRGQTLPGTNLPYLVHLSNVAMEVMAALKSAPEGTNADLAVACAILHDTMEDAGVTFQELERGFGPAVAAGVQALTKDPALHDKQARMLDSLERIREQSPEIAMVKLADRIANLQRPPAHWSLEKRLYYQEEARLILDQLKGVHPSLEERLAEKIETYSQWIAVE